MTRRNFTKNSSLLFCGLSITPLIEIDGFINRPQIYKIDDTQWLVKALGYFARYAALDVLAGHVWDYIFEDEDSALTTKDEIKNSTQMMKNGGFNNFNESTVYQNVNVYNTILYQGNKPSSLLRDGKLSKEDVCVAVTRTHDNSSSTPLMLDGPAIGMLANVAKDIRGKTNFGAKGVRGLLLPTGKIHQGSTGNLHTGYSKPIIYDTDAGKRVAIGYKVEDGIGKGELVVADIKDRTTLVNRLFEFSV